MAPVKIRQTLLGGSNKMIVYDDLEPTEKIKVYDKGISLNPTDEEKYDMRVDYRTADMYSPKLNSVEALAMLIQEFAECVSSNRKPITDANSGLRVVSILEAADISLSKHGAPVPVVVT
jgi:predicted dehydrogenase